jgi:hypothetical protein
MVDAPMKIMKIIKIMTKLNSNFNIMLSFSIQSILMKKNLKKKRKYKKSNVHGQGSRIVKPCQEK